MICCLFGSGAGGSVGPNPLQRPAANAKRQYDDYFAGMGRIGEGHLGGAI